MLRSVTRRQYRIARYDGYGDVIEGAQYVHVRFVHEVVATWSEDKSSQLLGSDPHYGGTLICRRDRPGSDS